MVKVCKKVGDTAEYRKFCHNELKLSLRVLLDGMLQAPVPETVWVIDEGSRQFKYF
jgi:hypothetical protein